MANPAVSFLLQKLDKLLVDEVQLLSGVKDGIQWIKDELEGMKVLLKNADEKRERNEAVDAWVRQVRDIAYDAEDVPDKFILEIARLQRRRGFAGCLMSSVSSIKEHKVATKIKERGRLNLERREEEGSTSNVVATRGVCTRRISSLLEEADLVGIEEKVKVVEGLLLDGDQQLKVISIVGMGRLGKTTLAKKIYNNGFVKKHFVRRAWVTISQSFNKIEIFNAILQKKLHAHLQDNMYLVVLDDVWKENVWKEMHNEFLDLYNGSRFIITTRMAEVTSPWSKVYKLEELTPEEAWLLFCKKAFGGTNGNSCPLELENIGRLVVKECEGLPLAIVAIGSVIYKRPKTIHAWDKVRRSLAYELDMDKGVKRILTLSYRDLSPLLKYCFLYCCFFPGDYEIPCRKVIRLWVSEGFIEGRRGITKMEVAADYFKELLDRSLIQVARLGLSGSIHTICVRDVMRNLGISLLEKEMFGAICDGKYNTFPDRIRHISTQIDALGFCAMNKMSCLQIFEGFGPTRSSVECLPNGVGDLVHLRYLGLRDTGVKKIPKSLGELDKLANKSYKKLTNLVYLNLGITWRLRVLDGSKDLANLQTLTCILGNSKLVRELVCLKHMRKLTIVGLHPNHESSPLLVHRVHGIGCTTSFLHILKPYHLRPLLKSYFSIVVCQEGCCQIGLNLSQLLLAYSNLTQDPFVLLQKLPNLVFLSLSQASYVGTRIDKCDAGGFPKLQALVLKDLEEWEEWGEVEEVAMAYFERVYIGNCRKLPQGFQYLTSLEHLVLRD
ncbi:hypothetical protein AMTRI_Chr10g230470 [Amborella trichopoda]